MDYVKEYNRSQRDDWIPMKWEEKRWVEGQRDNGELLASTFVDNPYPHPCEIRMMSGTEKIIYVPKEWIRNCMFIFDTTKQITQIIETRFPDHIELVPVRPRKNSH
jgi:hypothetical protein